MKSGPPRVGPHRRARRAPHRSARATPHRPSHGERTEGIHLEARDPIAPRGRAPDVVYRVTIGVAADDRHAGLDDLEHDRPLHPLIESTEEIEPARSASTAHGPGGRRPEMRASSPSGP